MEDHHLHARWLPATGKKVTLEKAGKRGQFYFPWQDDLLNFPLLTSSFQQQSDLATARDDGSTCIPQYSSFYHTTKHGVRLSWPGFIGVTPRQRMSGSSVKGRTMMSRSGHAQLRRALYMPGLVARRYNPVLKAFGDRLSAAGLAPKAVVGAAMRKLAHLIYGVINSGKPFDLKIAAPRLDFQDGI